MPSKMDGTPFASSATPQGRLIGMLREARLLMSRPDNDLARDPGRALAEIDGMIEALHAGPVPARAIAGMFVPIGRLSDEFRALAARVDAALEADSRDVLEFVAREEWMCGVCGEPAGTVELRRSAVRGALRRESFTGTLSEPLKAEAFMRLRAALNARDAGGLYALDPEYAPWYCPACRTSYCGDHWASWDDRRRCPEGHERMLGD